MSTFPGSCQKKPKKVETRYRHFSIAQPTHCFRRPEPRKLIKIVPRRGNTRNRKSLESSGFELIRAAFSILCASRRSRLDCPGHSQRPRSPAQPNRVSVAADACRRRSEANQRPALTCRAIRRRPLSPRPRPGDRTALFKVCFALGR